MKKVMFYEKQHLEESKAGKSNESCAIKHKRNEMRKKEKKCAFQCLKAQVKVTEKNLNNERVNLKKRIFSFPHL